MRVKRGAAHGLEIFRGEAELREHFFVRNGFVIPEPLSGGFDGAHPSSLIGSSSMGALARLRATGSLIA